jgi:hypothetical protein
MTRTRTIGESHPVRRGAARVALVLTLASAVSAVVVGTPSWVHAADRYALESGLVVLRSAGMPAIAGKVVPAATTLAGTRYALHGEIRGQSDSIFVDGFDLEMSYDDTFAEDIPLGDEIVELGSVTVPAGSYAVFVRLQARTGDDPDPGNNYRLDCGLSPGLDDATYRVGVVASVERYLNYQGAVTLVAADTIRFSCRSANNHEAMALSGKLTAIAVGGVD